MRGVWGAEKLDQVDTGTNHANAFPDPSKRHPLSTVLLSSVRRVRPAMRPPLPSVKSCNRHFPPDAGLCCSSQPDQHQKTPMHRCFRSDKKTRSGMSEIYIWCVLGGVTGSWVGAAGDSRQRGCACRCQTRAGNSVPVRRPKIATTT